jgi:hypothetical protein
MTLLAVYEPLIKTGKLEGIYKPAISSLFRRATTLPTTEPTEKEFKVNDTTTVSALCFYELYGAIMEARYPTVPLLFLPDRMFRKMAPTIAEMRANKNRLMSTSLTRQRLREYADSPLSSESAMALLTRSTNLRFTSSVLKDLNFPVSRVKSLFSAEELEILKHPRTLNKDEVTLLHNNNIAFANDEDGDLHLTIEEDFLTKLYKKCISI